MIQAIDKAEKMRKGKPTDMFNEVYDTLTPNLEKQKAELLEHLKTYKDQYPMETYEKL